MHVSFTSPSTNTMLEYTELHALPFSVIDMPLIILITHFLLSFSDFLLVLVSSLSNPWITDEGFTLPIVLIWANKKNCYEGIVENEIKFLKKSSAKNHFLRVT